MVAAALLALYELDQVQHEEQHERADHGDEQGTESAQSEPRTG